MKTISYAFVLGILLFSTACKATTNQNPEEPTSTGVSADAATQTEQALATQLAWDAIADTPPIILSAVPVPSETTVPTPTYTPTVTATIWTISPIPSRIIPLRTSTPRPPISTTYTPPCDFVAVTDVTVEPGTDFAPSESFVKTWRFVNIGSCTWTTSYAVVFRSGNDLSASGDVNFPKNVPPGESVEVSLNMEAPAAENNYVGYWMLRNADGKTFGSGPTASDPLVVEIDVLGYLPVSYNFAQRYCEATWKSAEGELPCPDTETDPDQDGYVRKLEKPKMETGYIENEPALLTHPQMAAYGYISGTFPAYTVQAGEHLYTVLSCQYGATNCDVTFWIEYQIKGSTTVYNLGSWNEKYDDQLTFVDIDLAPLVGQSVIFIFTVEAGGLYSQDEAFWLAPVIDTP